MNNDSFLIEENDLIPAREVCKFIENPEIRNRAVANNMAAGIAKKYFEEYEPDTESGLHNIASILKDLEISDIYIKGNYIDVRLYFNDNELCVPKSHFDNEITPVAYMFIKLNEDVSGATVSGFITPNMVNTDTNNNGYYRVDEQDLQSFYNIETLLVTQNEDEPSTEAEERVFDYLDNKLENLKDFYKELISSKILREKLIDAEKAKIVFNFVSINEPEALQTTEENAETEDLESFEIEDSLNLDLDTDSEISDIEEIQDFSISEDDLSDVEELELSPEDSEFNLDESEEIEPFFEENQDVVEEAVQDEVKNEEEITDFSSIFNEEETNSAETIEILETPEETAKIDEPISENTESLNIAFDNSAEDETEITEEIQEFSTMVTPSINDIEDESTPYKNKDNSIETSQLLEELQVEQKQENTEETSQEIEQLFNQEDDTAQSEEMEFVPPNKKKSLFLPILGITAIVAALGYFGYTKFASQSAKPEPIPAKNTALVDRNGAIPAQNESAMPVETVENTSLAKPASNEGNSISIPAIEQNLDASILVSNLSVNWEVPASYISNNTAKRYFTKMGKIIQLNLKTELLLLSKPPITNKIAVELEYDKGSHSFKIKEFTASSGEKSVDDIITKTIENALSINLNMNMSVFENVTGNPILVIRL